MGFDLQIVSARLSTRRINMSAISYSNIAAGLGREHGKEMIYSLSVVVALGK
jgi:hypothetical protein